MYNVVLNDKAKTWHFKLIVCHDVHKLTGKHMVIAKN